MSLRKDGPPPMFTRLTLSPLGPRTGSEPKLVEVDATPRRVTSRGLTSRISEDILLVE